ncbi:hypothetical protein SAMD00019534_088780 [Acytostelium subglobosum LB1]|uniref:hypothetical protein n=1 Tax=Acytostelium subglobosum LB1 TaxID=1410327 RepID=UPI000644E724|nr:hypothetical protein SAMD00019534_088780 [Acytostelium subglobosum LB1]GAM25703.1 hypothetical protein SAMD00019534_088780 [Acytostelium subglobosum LB1]|eukprot:XP_012751221.1 hypothetical protein SAMD00019534_088780 [Acytostelium subglobosum LB1]
MVGHLTLEGELVIYDRFHFFGPNEYQGFLAAGYYPPSNTYIVSSPERVGDDPNQYSYNVPIRQYDTSTGRLVSSVNISNIYSEFQYMPYFDSMVVAVGGNFSLFDPTTGNTKDLINTGDGNVYLAAQAFGQSTLYSWSEEITQDRFYTTIDLTTSPYNVTKVSDDASVYVWGQLLVGNI